MIDSLLNRVLSLSLIHERFEMAGERGTCLAHAALGMRNVSVSMAGDDTRYLRMAQVRQVPDHVVAYRIEAQA